MKYYVPILLVEIYLIFTLLLFSFGPIDYYLQESLIFWWYIVFYHIAMILGYVVATLPWNNRIEKIAVVTKSHDKCHERNRTRIRFLILIAFFAFLIAQKNATNSDSLIPVDFISSITNGLSKSYEQYILTHENMEGYAGDKFLNIIYFFVAFTMIILIPIIVFYWREISVVDRVVAIAVTFLPVLSGIASGTNKRLFDFVIFYGSSLALYFIGSHYRNGKSVVKWKGFFIGLILLMLFAAAIWFFGSAMLGRGGDPSYLESTSPLGHIKIDKGYLNSGEDSFFSYIYVWFSYYLVHGYYGFSQSISQEFTSTFGFGNSQFLMRQFEWLTGYDLMRYTYQHKIDSVWGETAQWHSLYSYIANDFHFFGVIVWNFVMGFFISKVWKSFLDDDNLYAKFLMPLFVMIIIFTPANNQVFGYLETFSTFFFSSLLWFASVYKGRVSCRN
jgi:hypothetical protein